MANQLPAGYGELEEPQPGAAEQARAIAGPLVDGIKRFGVGKLIFLLLVLAGVYWYLFIMPKPGTLTLTVVELDNEGTPVPAAEIVLIAESGPGGSTSTDASGFAKLSGVASQQSLTITVDGGSRYEPATRTVTLESGGTDNLNVALARRRQLEIVGTVPATVLAPKCSKSFTLQVKNSGKDEEDVEFVGDKLTAPLQLTSEKKAIPAGGTETLSFTISTGEAVAKKTASGRARIKFSKIGVDLSLPIEEAPRIDVSPSDVSCPRAVCNNVVTIKNNGKTTVSDITIATRGADALVSKIRFEGVTPPVVAKELAPGQEVKFAMVIEGVEPGIYTGFADVAATCFTKSISVKSEKRAD